MNANADADNNYSYVSTGHLPAEAEVISLIDEVYARYKSNTDGKNSQVYPALAEVPSDLFGVCVVGTNGAVYAVGDGRIRILDHERVEAVRLRAGLSGDRRGAGARRSSARTHRTSVQFARGRRTQRRWPNKSDGQCGRDRDDQPRPGARPAMRSGQFIHDGLSRFAGRPLALNDEVYASASETNFRNQSIARLLAEFRTDLLRSGRGDRSLHPAMLAERERQGSGGDGRDSCGRRRQPDHQRARGRCRRSVTTRWPS